MHITKNIKFPLPYVLHCLQPLHIKFTFLYSQSSFHLQSDFFTIHLQAWNLNLHVILLSCPRISLSHFFLCAEEIQYSLLKKNPCCNVCILYYSIVYSSVQYCPETLFRVYYCLVYYIVDWCLRIKMTQPHQLLRSPLV